MQVAFQIMGYIAVITNCCLIALLPSVKEYAEGYSDAQVIMFFVAAEVSVFTVLPVPVLPWLHSFSNPHHSRSI